MNAKGYSLFEFTVVLFLIGFLSALAVPSWLSFQQRQEIRAATSQLQSALQLAKSEGVKNSVRYAVTVCSNSLDSVESDEIEYSVHPYSDSPSEFTKVERVSLVKSTVRRSPSHYSLLSRDDCYTAYLGLFPGDGYALGFFYLANRRQTYIHRVGFNTLIGNVASCPVISLERLECR